jgi:hypothetical protein
VAQEIVAGASLIMHKWKDRVEQYDSFRYQVVKIVPDLAPPFEEE